MLDFSGHGEEFPEALERLRDTRFFVRGSKQHQLHFEQKHRALRVLPLRYEPYLGQDANEFIDHHRNVTLRHGAFREICEFADAFVTECALLEIPVFAHEIIRGMSRQAELFAGGFTKSASRGPHLVGCAVDLIHSVHAWDLSNRAWLVLGHIGKELAARRGFQVNWGGDWKADTNPDDPKVGWDPAHWELAYWRDVAGDYPFPEDYDWKAPRLARFDRIPVLF